MPKTKAVLTEQVVVRLPPGLKASAQQFAGVAEKNLSDWIRGIIEVEVKRQKRAQS